jgi:hypothetical protein
MSVSFKVADLSCGPEFFSGAGNPMNTVKIEFASRSFVIEEATLVLYNIPAARLASITGIDMPPGASVTDTILRELEGSVSIADGQGRKHGGRD